MCEGQISGKGLGSWGIGLTGRGWEGGEWLEQEGGCTVKGWAKVVTEFGLLSNGIRKDLMVLLSRIGKEALWRRWAQLRGR